MKLKEEYRMVFTETERVLLRKVRASDFEEYFCAYLMDKEMDKYMGRSASETPEDVRLGFDWFLNKEERAYVIVKKDDGSVIGNLTVYNKVPSFVAMQPQVQGKVGKSMSFALSWQWQRRGLMREAVCAVMKELFEAEHVDYINCGYLSFNHPSACFQKALGFSYLATENFEIDNVPMSSVENILTKESWQQNTSKS